MDFAYAIPGTAALIEWLLAAALYAVGWYRIRPCLNRVGDAVVAAGLFTTLAGLLWLAWSIAIELAWAPGSLATGLAASALIVYAVLAHRRPERLPALAVLVLSISVQVYAVVRLWWGGEVAPPDVFLSPWIALGTLAGFVGYGGLVVAAALIGLSFTLNRWPGRLSADRLAVAVRLPALEWWSVQIALVALSISLSMGLIHSWWGLGQVKVGGLTWALAIWLLITARAYSAIQGALSRRPARALLVLACLVGVVAALTILG